jgi:hypothetical protein
MDFPTTQRICASLMNLLSGKAYHYDFWRYIPKDEGHITTRKIEQVTSLGISQFAMENSTFVDDLWMMILILTLLTVVIFHFATSNNQRVYDTYHYSSRILQLPLNQIFGLIIPISAISLIFGACGWGWSSIETTIFFYLHWNHKKKRVSKSAIREMISYLAGKNGY